MHGSTYASGEKHNRHTASNAILQTHCLEYLRKGGYVCIFHNSTAKIGEITMHTKPKKSKIGFIMLMHPRHDALNLQDTYSTPPPRALYSLITD